MVHASMFHFSEQNIGNGVRVLWFSNSLAEKSEAESYSHSGWNNKEDLKKVQPTFITF